MAEQQTHESLNALQSMLNNVLMETGKALRAVRMNGRGPNVPAREPPARMSESIRTFHQALDSLEQDIVSAKSVLQRDLKQIREKNGQVSTPQLDISQPTSVQPQMTQTPAPQPVDAQTKSPMVIDLESSPPVKSSPTVVKTEPATSSAASTTNGATKGLVNGMSGPPPIPVVKSEPVPASARQQPMQTAAQAQAPSSSAAQVPTLDASAGADSTAAPDGGNELNFTNMTFSLAPPNEEAPMSTNPSDQSFDVSGLAPTGNGNDLMAVDNASAPDNNAENNTGSQAQDVAAVGASGDNVGSLDDFDFSLNEGPGDGLDFDFTIGGEDTFNTLMKERDGEFSMDQAFDADPFNLDKPEGT